MALRASVIAAITLGAALGVGGTSANAAPDQYYGRWAVSDEAPAYSSKGILYKTIDLAPCGDDFCGVSVAQDGSCGQVLFRFLTNHEDNDFLVGHGRWGKAKKKLEMGYVRPDAMDPFMYLALGSDDMDLSGREGSIPTFQANYARQGEASCAVD